jgi:hypothetical protein
MWGVAERKTVSRFSQHCVLKITDYGYVTMLFGNYLQNYTVSQHKTFRGEKQRLLLKVNKTEKVILLAQRS